MGESTMYVPKYFKVQDIEEIKDFINKYSFGTIVSTHQGKPIATHLPLELNQKDGAHYISGHMAYGNPQWKTFESGQDDVLVIYQGPHAYISSSWYHHENVSTWNYQAVHVYGTPKIIDEQELEQDLIKLMEKYEKHRENPVLWKTLSPQTKKQIKGIVGFKIKIKEIQAAYKLSQNRNEEDYHHIIKKLQVEGDPQSLKMAEIMEKQSSNRK